MGPVEQERTETEIQDFIFYDFLLIGLANLTSQQALMLLLSLLMKLLDKHLNGREKGSLFLYESLHGVGLLCGIDCRCVDLEESNVVRIMLSVRHR